jgi:hypothetical protein
MKMMTYVYHRIVFNLESSVFLAFLAIFTRPSQPFPSPADSRERMKAIACFALAAIVVAATVGAVSTAPAAPSADLPDNWSANFTLQNGENYTGYYIYDRTARRTFRRINELNQSTFVFESFGEPMLYTYNIGSSGCTCSTHKSGFVPSFWASFAASLKTGTCTGGDLYGNSDLVKGLPGTPTASYCVSPAGVPVWREEDGAGARYTFSSFESGPDRVPFPFEQFNGWVQKCSDACI